MLVVTVSVGLCVYVTVDLLHLLLIIHALYLVRRFFVKVTSDQSDEVGEEFWIHKAELIHWNQWRRRQCKCSSCNCSAAEWVKTYRIPARGRSLIPWGTSKCKTNNIKNTNAPYMQFGQKAFIKEHMLFSTEIKLWLAHSERKQQTVRSRSCKHWIMTLVTKTSLGKRSHMLAAKLWAKCSQRGWKQTNDGSTEISLKQSCNQQGCWWSCLPGGLMSRRCVAHLSLQRVIFSRLRSAYSSAWTTFEATDQHLAKSRDRPHRNEQDSAVSSKLMSTESNHRVNSDWLQHAFVIAIRS